LVAIALAAPHWISMAGRIVSAETGTGAQHANADISLKTTLSVFVRNMAVQMATPAKAINSSVEEAIMSFHEMIGEPPNNPKTTFAGTTFRVQFRPQYEDEATAAIHFVAILLLPVVAFVFAKGRRDILFLSLLPLVSMVVFSMILRWQPWHSRLLVPCIAFTAVPFGILAGRAKSRWLGAAILCSMALWLSPSFNNAHRSLFGEYSVFSKSSEQQRCGYSAEMDLGVRVLSGISAAIQPSAVLVDQSALYPFLLSLRFPDGSWPRFLQNLTEQPAVVIGNTFPADVMSDNGFIPLYSTRGVTIWVKADESRRLKSKLIFANFLREAGVSKIYSTGDNRNPEFFRNLLYPRAEFDLSPSSETRIFEVAMSFPEPGWSCKILCDGREIGVFNTGSGQRKTTVEVPPSSSSLAFCFENSRSANNRHGVPVARLHLLRED
jgi:hypothetical protein